MRIDSYLSENGFCASRTRACELIKNGLVKVGGKTVKKPSEEYEGGEIVVENDIPYVSRGGLKLKKAIDFFGIDCKGLVALDIGASTGGFTDCLLKEGARKVYCVDSGEGQLHVSLESDERVVSFEHINARYMTEKLIGEKVDIITMDVSFISQTLIFDALCLMLKDGGVLVSLIKPQFEVGREKVGKGGIVKDEKARKSAVDKVIAEAEKRGLECLGTTESPITGGDGNIEFLAMFRKG